MALVLGVLVALISLPVSADVVTFPDPGLELSIRQAIGKPREPIGIPTGDIYNSDLLRLTSFISSYIASSRKISNLEGIQLCSNLTELGLNENKIADISVLSSLANLTALGLGDNQIVDISPLSRLTNLTGLALHINKIVDISPLSGLINLTYLDLAWNQIVDIGTLAGLTKLTELDLNDNQIVDITALAGLTNLTTLYLHDNQIVDIQGLVDNTGLGTGDTVSIWYNYLDLIPGSDDMQNIQTLIDRGVDVEYKPQHTPENQPPETVIADASISGDTASFTWSGSDDTTPTVALTYSYRLVRPGPTYDTWSSWSSEKTTQYTDLSSGTYRFQVRAKDADEGIVPSPANREFTIAEAPLNCVVHLRPQGIEASIGVIGHFETFDIYVGASAGDIDQVRFSSDEVEDGQPTGEWTRWFDWNASSEREYWDATAKTRAWAFTTSGEKEVWVEVRDQAGQSTKCYAPISANPVEEASKQFGVGEYVRIKKSPSAALLEEPRADSTLLYQVWHRTPARILPNEDNGSYADGYAWWYVETNVEGRAFPISGWCREIDLEKNVLPTASFTHFPLTPTCGEDVVLDARTSEDSDGEIVVWRWNLNGAGGYTINPEIVYYWDKPGEYSVTLEVEDDTCGTGRITKTISVREKSLWEQLEDLFSSVARFDSERLKEIKRELQIKNWSQEMPIYDPDPLNPFYNYSDGDLATVLIQEMDKENAPGVTYGAYILDSIREKNLVRMASSTAWQNAEVIDAYFNDLADVNVWANTAGIVSQDLLVGLIEHAGGSGLGISTILSLPALCKAGIGLKALDNTLYRRALWRYFECRRFEDANAAFEDAGVPTRYYKTETKDYFESLWDTYQEFGSGSNLERSWRANLQNFLLAALEKYKFYTQIVLLKSAGELRVYDSQNRVTGLVNGEVKQEIPNSIYDEESKTAVISPATDSYRYVVVGVEQGDYGLDAISITSGEASICTVTEMTTAIGAVHQYTMNWDALSKGETGTTLQVDKNGDGVFEKTYQAGSTLEGRQLSTSLGGRTSLWLWIVVGLAIGSVGVVVGGLIWTRILRKS